MSHIFLQPGHTPQRRDWLAGAGGLEPPNGGIKIRCLTTWLRPIAPLGRRLGARTIAAGPAPINVSSRRRGFRAVDRGRAGTRLTRRNHAASIERRGHRDARRHRRRLAGRDQDTSVLTRRPDDDLPGAGCRHRLCAQARRRSRAGAGRGPLRRPRRGRGRGRAGGGGQVRDRGARAAQRVGDRYGTPFKDGAVTTAPGWKEAYRAWTQAGWNGLAAPAQWGGQGLPHAAQRRLHRNVELGRHGLRPRPAADHGGRSTRSSRTAATNSSAPICRSSCPANGWAPCS